MSVKHRVIIPTGMPHNHRVLRFALILAKPHRIESVLCRHGRGGGRKKPWDSVAFFHKDMRVARVFADVVRGLLKLDRLMRRKERGE